MNAVWSKQIGLFHDSDKLFFGNLSIAVSVCLVYHFLQLLVSHGFSQLSGHSLQVFQWNLSSAIIVEKSESLENFLSWISFANLSGHEFHEISKLNDSFSISINFSNKLFDFLFLWFKAQGSHGNLQFFWINVPWNETKKYQQTRYQTSRMLLWFIVFVLQWVSFWPFGLAWVGLFISWRWSTFEFLF